MFFFYFRGENLKIYLSEPQRAPPCAKTCVLTYCSSKSVAGFVQGAIARNTKNYGVGGHLGFSNFCSFEHTALLGVGVRLCMPNFIMIGLTVQKLLAFFVFHRKCIESAQKLGFLAILGAKTEIFIFLSPKGHLLVPKHAF